TLREIDLDRRCAAAFHDGYRRLSDPVTHHRRVCLLADGLVVIYDTLTASGEHHVAQRWPLHPDVKVTAIDRLTVQGALGDIDVWIRVLSTTPARLSVLRGQR